MSRSNLSLKDNSPEEVYFFQLRNSLHKKQIIEKKNIIGIILTLINERVHVSKAISLRIMAKIFLQQCFC